MLLTSAPANAKLPWPAVTVAAHVEEPPAAAMGFVAWTPQILESCWGADSAARPGEELLRPAPLPAVWNLRLCVIERAIRV
jgi:hypothetical protein